jgi:hypothetical protein
MVRQPFRQEASVQGEQQRGRGRWTAWIAAALVGVSTACAPSSAAHGAEAPVQTPAPAAAASEEGTRAQTIDHLTPPRDSVGKSPASFSWTPVEGAETYSIGIWNEVDRMVWRQNGITTTSVVRPDDLELEPGTYFWTISALRGGQQIAESGLAAFVVRTIP